MRLKSILYETLWKRVFRWYEPFSSLDNWPGTGAHLESGGVFLTTAATPGDEAQIRRMNWNRNTTNTFDRNSSVRFSPLFIGQTTDQSGVYYLTVGDSRASEQGKYYGFKVENGGIYGVVSAGGRTKEIVTARILTAKHATDDLTFQETYLFEARYYAGVKVDFFVTVNPNGVPAKVTSVPQASLRSPINIPSELTMKPQAMFTLSAKTYNNEYRLMGVSDIDYIGQLDFQ